MLTKEIKNKAGKINNYNGLGVGKFKTFTLRFFWLDFE